MDTKSLVTIIIPMYNAADYIGRTLECLNDQTMQDFDVVFVDNNSHDDVALAINNKMKTFGPDAFFYQIVTEKNRGVSFARNTGIEYADGKYILFIDADDSFSPDFIEKLTDVFAREKSVDLVYCGYDTHEERVNKAVYESPEDSPQMVDSTAMLKRVFEVEHYQGFIWNKLFRSEIIKQNNLKFDTDIYYNEDRLFLVNYLLHCQNVCMIPDRLYHYQLHKSSAQGKIHADSLGQFEKNATEIVAFDRMRKALKKSDALTYCEKDMAFSILRLFRPLLTSDVNSAYKYKNSILRKYARFAFLIHFEPKDLREKVAFRKFIQYGWTGSVYTKDLTWFERDD